MNRGLKDFSGDMWVLPQVYEPVQKIVGKYAIDHGQARQFVKKKK